MAQTYKHSTDPYILLDGKRYPIEHDGEYHTDGGMSGSTNWAGDTPTCPSCHEPIEDYSGQAPYESDAYSYERIECECGARFEVQHD